MDARALRRTATWFAVGFLVGMGDLLVLEALGVTMLVDGRDVTAGVVTFFALNFGVLFAVIARLRGQRGELQELADVVSAQYGDLQDTQQELSEARELAAIGRLSSGVAHEVRNPLGVIRASASMIMEDIPDPESEVHEAACFIRDEVDRLDGFVRRLMDYTRPLQAERLPLDAGELLGRVAALSEPFAEERGVRIEIERAGSLDVPLRGDEELLSRLMLGLTRNAVAAARARVVLGVRLVDGEVVLEVRDDGEGVPEDLLDEVFSPFYTTRADGTGLGLAMARKIANAHDARVALLPSLGLGPGGQGACARVSLSLEEVP